MIYIFLLEIIFLICILLVILKGDIFSPALCVCYVFLFSTLCVIYNQKYWEYKMSFQAWGILSLGLWIFAIASIITLFIYKKMEIPKEVDNIQYISIEKWKSVFIIFFELFFSAIYLKNVLRIIRAYTSSTNWYEMMKRYRQVSSYGILSSEQSIPSYSVYTFRMVEVFGYLYTYILINNLFADRKSDKIKKFEVLQLLPIVIYIVGGILTSGRMYILQYASAVVFIFYIIWHRKYGWNKFVGFKVMIKLVLLFISVLLIFVLTRNLVGRGIEFDPLYYIALYGGQSIPDFDMFLQDPPISSNIWGKETFIGIINFIGKITGNDRLRYISHKEFRYLNGIFLGNVYTAFRKYIYDFGYIGLVVLTSLASIFYTAFYKRCKFAKGHTCIDYRLIVFSYFSYGIFYYSIDDRLFGQLFTVGTLIWIFLMYAAGLFLKMKIRLK